MDVGQKIKALREEKGMTLEQLGDKVGVGKSTVRKWETGIIANMRRDKIAKIADALGTSPAYLMGWDNNNYQDTQPVLLGSELNNIFERLAEEYNKPKEDLISSLFFRMKPITIAVMGFLFFSVFMRVCEIFAYQRNSDISVKKCCFRL